MLPYLTLGYIVNQSSKSCSDSVQLCQCLQMFSVFPNSLFIIVKVMFTVLNDVLIIIFPVLWTEFGKLM